MPLFPRNRPWGDYGLLAAEKAVILNIFLNSLIKKKKTRAANCIDVSHSAGLEKFLGECGRKRGRGEINTKWLRHTKAIQGIILSYFKWNQVLQKINFDLMNWKCWLLVAATDSQMTLSLMGMQSGKLGAERMKKNIMEEQGYWHVVAYLLTKKWFQFTSRKLLWIPNLILVRHSFHY